MMKRAGYRVGEKAQWLGALAALPEDLRSTHGGSNALSWPPQAHPCAYRPDTQAGKPRV